MSSLATLDRQMESPFRFLEYFREEDEARFAGRSHEISSVVTGVLSTDAFVLYGRSGLGKTSLLFAGIFPQLKRLGYDPHYLRLLDSPVMQLRTELLGQAAHRDVLRAIQEAKKPIVLVLDQFEEFFIRLRERPHERREFSATLGSILAGSRGKLRILFGIREDYYAELEDFRADIPAIVTNGFRLLPLTAYGAREAILLPIEQARVAYEERLINRLVDELAKCNFDPLLLQIICTEVWREAQKREGPVELTAADFEAIGGVEGIFRQYVQSVGSGLEPDKQLLVRTILDTLTTAERTKRTVRTAELVEGAESVPLYVRATEVEVIMVLERLLEHRLVRRVQSEYDSWYELLHDRLVAVVQEWLSLDQDFVHFRFAKMFVSNFAAGRRFQSGSGYLLSSEQMEQMVDPWRLRLRLSSDETELLFRSAIAGQTPSMNYWATRVDEFGINQTDAVVGQMLGSDDESIRSNASTALRVLPQGKAFVPQLLKIALEDADKDARTAASAAFAELASDEELRQLRAIVRNRASRERGVAILIECYDQLRVPLGLPWATRVRAWRAVQQRNIKERRDEIAAATKSGALRGLIAGFVWTLLVAAPLVMAFFWNAGSARVIDGKASTGLLIITGALSLVLTTMGLFIGSFSARREAKRAAAEKWEGWKGGATRGFWQGLIIMVLAAAVVMLVAQDDPDVVLMDDINQLALTLFAATLLASAIASLSLPAMRTREDGADRRWGGLLWVRIVAIVAPLALVAAVSALTLTGFIRFLPPVLICVLMMLASAPVAALVRRWKRSCGASDGMVNGAFWSVAVSGAMAVIGIAAVVWTVERDFERRSPWLWLSVFGMAVILLGSFRGCVLALSVPSLSASTKGRYPGRILVMLSLVFFGVTYVAIFGVRSIPVYSNIDPRPLGAPIKGRLAAVVPNAHYYVISPHEGSRLFAIDSPDVSANLDFDYGQSLPGPRSMYYSYPSEFMFAAAPFRLVVSRSWRKQRYVVTPRVLASPSQRIASNVVELTLEYQKGFWRPIVHQDIAIQLPFVVWSRDQQRAFTVAAVQRLERQTLIKMSAATKPVIVLGGLRRVTGSVPAFVANHVLLQLPAGERPKSLTLVAIRTLVPFENE